MKNLVFIFCSIWLCQLSYSIDANAEKLPVSIYRIKVGTKENQNVWALISKDFSDIRYDQDGDGQIDQWLISRNETKTTLFYRNKRLVGAKINTVKHGARVTLEFISKNEKLIYVGSTVDRHILHFYSQKIAATDSMSCKAKSVESLFDAEQWTEMMSNFQLDAHKDSWNKKIANTCSIEKESVQSAIRESFGLDPKGTIGQNKFLSCLSENSNTKSMVPDYVDIALTGPTKSFQFECLSTKDKCISPSVKPASKVIYLPLPSSTCPFDPKIEYPKIISHETLHLMSSSLDESSINGIVSACFDDPINARLRPPNGSEDKNSLSIFRPNEGEHTMNLAKQSAIQTYTNMAQKDPVTIPREVAIEGFVPDTPPGFESTVAALSSVFAESNRVPASVATVSAEKLSEALRSRPFAATADLVGRMTIAPAVAATPTIAQDLNRGATDGLDSANSGTSRAGTALTSTPKDLGPTASPQRNIATVSPSAPTASSGASGTSASSSSKPSSAAVTPSAKAAAPSNQDLARAALKKTLTGMTAWEARAYVAANEARLILLEVLFRDKDNNIKGFNDPAKAKLLLWEDNGKVKAED